tara:strand:- start:83 stop:712 length:630 start_codon:yes stop_codon:yes gene_type:complete
MIGNYKDTTPIVKFDGRSFNYRRPTGEDYSPHEYEWLNPVYAYSKGRVRDAALQLGITNVHQPEQVKRILAEIRNGPATRMAQQQQVYQQQMQATANASAAANTKQLQIIQSEKSAVSKMMADYSAQVKAQAEAQAKAQKEAQKKAAAALAASSANQSMMGKSANLQLQPASGTPKTAGTQGFKKLKNQFKINPSYNALGTMKSGTLNI